MGMGWSLPRGPGGRTRAAATLGIPLVSWRPSPRPPFTLGARPLDQERPAPDPSRPSEPPPPSEPPGVFGQFRATKDAVIGLIRAHVELAKTEADEIKGEVGRAAAMAGVILACLILLAFLVSIGTILFTGDLVFGSIGWGVLHGALTLIGISVATGLAIVRVPGLGWDAFIATLIGLVLAVVFALSVPHALWQAIGDAANIGDPAWRALAVGMLVLGVVGGLTGLVLGIRASGGGAILGGLIGGLAVGALIGAFTAITFDPRAGAGVGVTLGLLAWTALMGARVARQGIDTEAVKARFWPQTTIDTTLETIEWAKAKNPRGSRS
jgi:hypothetical protein